ncbi:MAG: hypothetical protein RXP99_03210 [Vulcanisaeta sp.]
MNTLELLVRVRRITGDMVKEAFIARALKEGSILSLSTEDVINLYPYNAYDYRVDGKNLDYVMTEDSVALLADLAKINNWSIDNVRYAEFDDCLSISTSEGVLSITCKDKSVQGGERVAYLDKSLLRRHGVDVKVRVMDNAQLMPLERLLENPTNIVVEGLVSLPLYFVINPTRLSLDLIADAYVYLLTKGLNRVPTNIDVAEYLISANKLNDDYIRVYVLRHDLEALREYLNVGINEGGGVVEYVMDGNHVLTASPIPGSAGPELLKVNWVDLEALRLNGVGINLVDMGSTNILDCSELLIERMREELQALL